MSVESFDTVIQNAHVVLPQSVERVNIGIKNGRIAKIGDLQYTSSTQVLDATGKLIMPGMIDIHVHFNEPGTDWEGFKTGSKALAAGGCTTYFDMPLNSVPPTINKEAFIDKSRAASGSSYIDYVFWGGLVPGNLTSIDELAKSDVIGFKAFLSSPGGPSAPYGFNEVDDVDLYQGMQAVAKTGKILALHAESEPIVSRLAQEAIQDGRNSYIDYVRSRPVLAEVEAVNRALMFAEQTGCKLHFVHISSPGSIEYIQAAKHRGVDVSLETCPHYLVLTEDDLASLGVIAKCAPPLRSLSEQRQLWEHVSKGNINLIASDHSPCPTELKLKDQDDFFSAWGGIAGGQSSLELMIEEACLVRDISFPMLANLVSTQPAKRFGLYPKKGAIQHGFDADLAIIDIHHHRILGQNDLFQRHRHSPYLGRHFRVRVEQTLVRGQTVYLADEKEPFPHIPIGQYAFPLARYMTDTNKSLVQ